MPDIVGDPDGVIKDTKLPKNLWNIMDVSGFANRKKTRAL